jgi:ATP-binding cassette subfamily F protein uup
VVVTHDRWFLDAVCSVTWEVQGGEVRPYDGGYSSYVLARAERDRMQAATDARRANLVRKELAWLRRGPPARTSKPQFRIDAANALIADEPPPRNDVELMRFASARLGRTVYDVKDVTLSVHDRVLLDDVTWHAGPGDRIGIAGVNGSGKTSFLRLLVGAVEPAKGSVKRGVTVRPGYLSQDVVELDPTMRVLEAVEDVRRVVELGPTNSAGSAGRKTISATQMCERFGFVGDAQWTPVGELSGGERRRLQLLRLLMDEPNVLLLDEPTNDLDIDTLTALEDLLDGWAGTLLVVSHDRYFLERVCDRTYALLGDGGLRDLPGGVDEYLALRRDRAASAGSGSGSSGGSPSSGETAPVQDSAAARLARKELTKVERQLDKLRDREKKVHDDMAAAAADHERVLTLDATLRDLRAERDRLEERWLELAADND